MNPPTATPELKPIQLLTAEEAERMVSEFNKPSATPNAPMLRSKKSEMSCGKTLTAKTRWTPWKTSCTLRLRRPQHVQNRSALAQQQADAVGHGVHLVVVGALAVGSEARSLDLERCEPVGGLG